PAAPGKAAAPKPPPPAPKKPCNDDDDEGGGTYGVIKEPEKSEEEDDEEAEDRIAKSNLAFLPDLSVKNPRGPAMAKLVRPYNWVMIWAVLGLVIGLGNLACAGFPLIFSEELVSAESVLKDKDGKPITKERKDLTKDELAQVEAVEFVVMIWRLVWVAAAVVGLVYHGLIIFGAVKAQNLESYGWGMASAIMTIISGGIIGILIGIWAIRTLTDPEVKAGFAYRGEEDEVAEARRRLRRKRRRRDEDEDDD
ncbi:MAG TPA: hypothetical protein VFA26_09105, partial [Gemmataceae bacterium]|nr:hypothetical protein [Gemmataceae bacterium]